MDKVISRLRLQWRDAVMLLLGTWLFASPFVFDYADSLFAMYNAIAFGAIIAVAAIAALSDFHEWEEWVSAAFGAWLMASPWVLDFTAVKYALVNHVVIGLIVAALAAWTILKSRTGDFGQQRA